MSGDTNMVHPAMQRGKDMYYTDKIPLITNVISEGAWSDPISCQPGMPKTSKLGIFLFGIGSTDDGSWVSGTIRPNNSIRIDPTVSSRGDMAGDFTAGGLVISPTNDYQQIQHYEETAGGSTINTLFISQKGYTTHLRD